MADTPSAGAGDGGKAALERRVRALEKANRLLTEMVELASDGIVLLDPSGVITECNRAAAQLVGSEKEAIVGKHITALEWLDAALMSGYLREFSALLLGEHHGPIEVEWVRTGGERRFGDARATPLVVDNKTVGLLVTVRDTTRQRRAAREREQLEEQMQQSQRMEAIGALAGGIAHDFNNLLTGIQGSANLIQLDTPPGSDAHDAATLIDRAAQRGSGFTRQLLGFARKGKLRNTVVDLNETVASIAALLERTIDKRIEIRVLPCADGAFVTGDPGQLEQAVLNLAVNARDAMPEGGELRIETGTVVIDDAQSSELPPGRYVRLIVSDTGAGSDESVQERVLEPVFTEEHGQGTGMGLAVVHRIVTNHRGSISVHSEQVSGSSFEVLLPRAEKRLRATAHGKREGVVVGEGAILVADDEAVIRSVVGTILERFGYEVALAASGVEALERYRERAGGFDLVILDVSMPGMDGRVCLQELRKINPDARVVLATGHDTAGLVEGLLEEGTVDLLEKPFSAPQLSQVVAAAMQRRR